MKAKLQTRRKYTWANGGYEYTLFKDGVYCHTAGVWLNDELSRNHQDYVIDYPHFRYLDEEMNTSEEAYEAALERSMYNDVRQPSHYQVFPNVESIEIIARSMTQEEFKGFCLGNVLKYRLRAGKKSELATMEKDLKKADFYKELFEQHKDKCYA